MTIARILVGLDGSALAEGVLATVRTLASRLRAEILLLHVVHVPEMQSPEGRPAVDDVIARERAGARTYLDGLARDLATADLAVRTAVRVGNPSVEIVRAAEHERADLIALATHGRSGVRRWMFGSVAEAVLHTTTTPLLLLRATADGVAGVAETPRLVVPLDGSAVAETALAAAEGLARAFGAPITLLRVVELIGVVFAGEPLGTPYFDYQRVLDETRAAAEQYLAGVAAAMRARGVAVDTVVATGIPVEIIAAETRRHAGSLLVMTTHGRTGWRALLLGSVARRVVQSAGGPVLLVRPAPVAAATADPPRAPAAIG